MIEDIRTVMWKERKGLMLIGGSVSRTLFTLLTPVVMLGIVIPLTQREAWLETGFSLIAAILLPLVMVAMVVPESFAGERERHTLPTLLASRLPDRAILFGKLLLAVVYGWLATLLILLVSVLAVNILLADDFQFFPLELSLANVLISFLTALFVGLLGVLVSMRAPTVQGAQQVLLALIMIPGLVLQVAMMVLFSMDAEGEDIIEQILSTDFTHIASGIAIFLTLSSVLVFYLVINRFNRAGLLVS